MIRRRAGCERRSRRGGRRCEIAFELRGASVIDDIRISHKIAALVIGLGLICIGLAGYAGLVLTRTSAEYAVLTDRKGPALVALAGAERANYEMAYATAMVIVYPGASEQGRAWARAVTTAFKDGQTYLIQARAETPDRRTEIADLEARLKTNKIRLDIAVELALFNRLEAASAALTRADPGLIAFGDLTREMIDDGVEEHRAMSTNLAGEARHTRWVLLFASLIGVVLAVGGALWMTATAITAPLGRLREGMQTLAAGDHDLVVEGQTRGDEIGAMARAVQVFKDNAVQLLRTERAAVERETARLKAEAANAAQRQFLAHMTHELRTPLNGVLGMAYLMDQGRLEPEQRARLETLQASGHDLLQVINNILDISKIEAGKLELDVQPFDVEAVCARSLGAFAEIAQEKGLGFRIEVAPSARGQRRGDPERVRQILVNYVANALKFTSTGEVIVVVEGDDAERGEGLHLSVRDTGPGIAPDKMSLLFQSFSQVDASVTRAFDGTGLGLAICRELAGLMQGRVWVESEPGAGSAFHAWLALPRCDDETPSATVEPCQGPAAADVEGLRVLAAEDNLTNQRVLTAILAAFGVDVRMTANGREVVAAWEGGGHDVILMDIQMPLMDGLEATQAIRAAEASRGLAPIPIFALTANAFVHQVEAYAAAGMDGHIAKPIDLQRLQAILQAVACRRPADSRHPHGVPRDAGAPEPI